MLVGDKTVDSRKPRSATADFDQAAKESDLTAACRVGTIARRHKDRTGGQMGQSTPPSRMPFRAVHFFVRARHSQSL